MKVLLMRLEGPMQSWGTQSRFTYRDTGLEPSKSGVIGLLCAALGKHRGESLDPHLPTLQDLSALRMGVRVDREGTMKVDYHTAGGSHSKDDGYGVALANGKENRTVQSWRYYLADASFLVGLEGRTPQQERLLDVLDRALDRPVWPLYLGRKAFVPGVPVRLPDGEPEGPGLRDGSLEEVLVGYPWFRWRLGRGKPPESIRLVLEDPGGEDVRRDIPFSFAPDARQFGVRRVSTIFRNLGKDIPVVEE